MNTMESERGLSCHEVTRTPASSQSVCKDCGNGGECKAHVESSPSSPEPDGTEDREWQSDTSEGGANETYQPMVSPISSIQFRNFEWCQMPL
jgi:hypothetical protein